MEDVIVDDFGSTFIFSCLIEQSGVFEDKVVALGNEFRMRLELGKTELVRLLHALVKLVELHEDAAVRLVETESALHALQRFFRIVLFVAVNQSEVSPNFREFRIAL